MTVTVDKDASEIRIDTPFPLEEGAVSAKSSAKKGTLSITVPAKNTAR